MTQYFLGRMISLVFVVWAVSIVTFVMMHAVPGGPFDETKGRLPPAARENIMRKYGLDKPYHVQYLNYMKNALRFDFGIPFSAPTSTVSELILKHWRITAQVGLMTILFAFGGGITLGILAAQHQNSVIDNIVTFLAMLGVSIPNFVVALWLLLIFSVRLDLLPLRGWSSSGNCVVGNVLFCSDWILPVFAYAIGPLGVIGRYTRASVVDVIRQDYSRTARAKGLSERLIMTRHVLRNAQIPMITALATEIPNLMTGSIFIESTFGINGLGRFFVTSVFNRDYPMIMALFLLIAFLWSLTYLLSDLAYTWADPRIRLGHGQTA